MMPRTINNLCCLDVLSAMQKYIRRGEERQAMHCACELAHTSKPLFSMVANRLEVISHEDVGLANPVAILFVAAAVDLARRTYDPSKPGKWRLPLGNAIRILCRSPKSREGDHFQAAVGQAALMGNIPPELPDYAFCMHTLRGKKAKRGLKHFLEVATLLVPPADPDPYQDEAALVWARKQQEKNGDSSQTDLF